MKPFIFALCLLSAALAENKLVWESLYPPPFTGVPPQVVISLACANSTLCFVPGGSNGVGFIVYQFDGQRNGKWTRMTMDTQMLMIVSAAAGTSPSGQVYGVVGGMSMLGITSGLAYYDASTEAWLKSQTTFQLVSMTQAISMRNGTEVAALDTGAGVEGLYFSGDGGASFVTKKIPALPQLNNCSEPQGVAVVDRNTWFVSLGSFPPKNQHLAGGIITYRKSRALSLRYHPHTKRVSTIHHSLQQRIHYQQRQKCGFSANIVKTTDGGKTWESLYAHNSSFDMGMLACWDANNCVAVSEGIAEGGPVNYIFRTTNGRAFVKVLTVVSSASTEDVLYSVAYRSQSEVWVAGGSQTQTSMSGLFYFSNDGGATWARYPVPQPEIGQIMEMSFVPGGDGFAAAVTQFSTSTILKYAVQPYYGFFSQRQCANSECTFLCQTAVFPQGMCLPTRAGSITIICQQNVMQAKAYNTTACQGPYTSSTLPTNVCLKSTEGTYFENSCSANSNVHSSIRYLRTTTGVPGTTL